MLSGKILQVHKSMRFCEKSCVSLKHIALCEENIVLIQKTLRFLRNHQQKSVLHAHRIKKFSAESLPSPHYFYTKGDIIRVLVGNQKYPKQFCTG
jgi:hypothetical protein